MYVYRQLNGNLTITYVYTQYICFRTFLRVLLSGQEHFCSVYQKLYQYYVYLFIFVLFCSFIISILFFLLFISAPLRLDILLQDEKIARLNQQIHELTVLNRKCDKHRKRQLRFLQALINSFKGDNVPLSENVCTRECQKYNVKSNLCNMLCTATTSTPWSMNDIGGDYKFPCDQNWKKRFNQQIRKYDETNSFLYHTNSNKAREKEKSLQIRLTA